MKDIIQTIILYHRRKKHIVGLFAMLILALLIGPFLGDLALSEKTHVIMQWNISSIEIIGLLFSLYFAANAYSLYQEKKIRTLLTSKKASALACIGGVIVGLSIIMIIYSIIGALILWGLGDIDILTALTQSIQRSIISIIIIGLAVLFSLYASSYITIMAVLIIYMMSYSINFLLFITDNKSDSGIHNMLSIIALMLPRFDLLGSDLAGSRIRGRSVFSHLLYAVVCISLAVISFSHIHSGKSSPALTHDSRKKG